MIKILPQIRQRFMFRSTIVTFCYDLADKKWAFRYWNKHNETVTRISSDEFLSAAVGTYREIGRQYRVRRNESALKLVAYEMHSGSKILPDWMSIEDMVKREGANPMLLISTGEESEMMPPAGVSPFDGGVVMDISKDISNSV